MLIICPSCNTGLEILAFPCNQFGGQEPGSIEDIQQMVCTRFKAEYPIFDKVATTQIFLSSGDVISFHVTSIQECYHVLTSSLSLWSRLMWMAIMLLHCTNFWNQAKVVSLGMVSSGTSPNSSSTKKDVLLIATLQLLLQLAWR